MLKSFFKYAGKFLKEFLYPKQCVFCNSTIWGFTEHAVCNNCKDADIHIKCVRSDKYAFDEAIGVIKYEKGARKAMGEYKFHGVYYYAYTFAFIMNENTKDRSYLKEALMCPVPLSYGREREYNQTALLAREINKLWNNEYTEDLMYKSREVAPLSKMKLPQRRFYVKNAFSLNPQYDIYGKDILLIEDIFTSGTTADECAKVLKANGANKVYVLAACYD